MTKGLDWELEVRVLYTWGVMNKDCNDSETNGGTDAKNEMETGVLYSETHRTAVTIFLCERSTIGRSFLKVLLVEPKSTNTFW
jgi:hypothetical protein